eukprot:snap_masked-scaffold_53-processed-gene-1.47-mRNA-1 protein AED:1.00 eAED:1.00 QI:0/-1/0/0/-1/1/1/0/578
MSKYLKTLILWKVLTLLVSLQNIVAQVGPLPFNDQLQETVNIDDEVIFSILSPDSQMIMFQEEVGTIGVGCLENNPLDVGSILPFPVQTIDEGYYIVVNFSNITDPFTPLHGDNILLSLVDSAGNCVLAGNNPVHAFIYLTSESPTASPTSFPTSAPLEEINTEIPWNKPQELQRWSNWFQITEGETITFNVLQEHNLLELANREAYDDCLVTELGPGGLIVDKNTEKVTVPFGQAGSWKYFTCNKTAPEPDNIDNVNDCVYYIQKIRVEVVERGDEYILNWKLELNDDDVRNFQEFRQIEPNQPIRFFNDDSDALDIRQFSSKEAYDNCIFFQSVNNDLTEDEVDVVIDGNPSFAVGDTTNNNNVLYRDFLQGTRKEFQTLYFGSSTQVSCANQGGALVSACECGVKTRFNVSAINPPVDVEEEENSLLDNIHILGAAGVVGGLLSVALLVLWQVRKNREEQKLQNAANAMDAFHAQQIAESKRKSDSPKLPPGFFSDEVVRASLDRPRSVSGTDSFATFQVPASPSSYRSRPPLQSVPRSVATGVSGYSSPSSVHRSEQTSSRKPSSHKPIVNFEL